MLSKWLEDKAWVKVFEETLEKVLKLFYCQSISKQNIDPHRH